MSSASEAGGRAFAGPSLSTVFAGQQLVLDGRAALYWPAQRALVVADLHLEKGSYLRRCGHPLPLYDTTDTLARLRCLVDHYRPERIIALGDSFHDAAAVSRLPAPEREQIETLCARADWVWILGNHDPHVPDCLPGRCAERLQLGDLLLLHEPSDIDLPQIIGHFHPKASLRLAGTKVGGKCFLQSPIRLLLPAFGSYTGGLDSDHPAIAGALGAGRQKRFLLHAQKIWQIL